MEAQPKARGSTELHYLLTRLMKNVLKSLGLSQCLCHARIIPMATGMSLVLVFSTLRLIRPVVAEQPAYIIMPRIDQKSCIKAIITAGKNEILWFVCLIGQLFNRLHSPYRRKYCE